MWGCRGVIVSYMGQNPPSAVPAARQALRVLSHLGAQRGPVPASAVARDLGIPRSACYRILTALVDHGYAIHYPEERRYGLGYAAYELSSGFSRQAPLSRLGAPILAALVDHVGETAHLGVLDGTDVIYLLEQRAPHRPVLITDVGVRLPAHQTATGRSLLACLPATQLRALYLEDPVYRRSARPFRDLPHLRRTLGEVTRAGFAAESGEVSDGFASVAVAIRDRNGWPAASLAVTFPHGNVPEESWPDLAQRIERFASELGRRLSGAVTAR